MKCVCVPLSYSERNHYVLKACTNQSQKNPQEEVLPRINCTEIHSWDNIKCKGQHVQRGSLVPCPVLDLIPLMTRTASVFLLLILIHWRGAEELNESPCKVIYSVCDQKNTFPKSNYYVLFIVSIHLNKGTMYKSHKNKSSYTSSSDHVQKHEGDIQIPRHTRFHCLVYSPVCNCSHCVFQNSLF